MWLELFKIIEKCLKNIFFSATSPINFESQTFDINNEICDVKLIEFNRV